MGEGGFFSKERPTKAKAKAQAKQKSMGKRIATLRLCFYTHFSFLFFVLFPPPFPLTPNTYTCHPIPSSTSHFGIYMQQHLSSFSSSPFAFSTTQPPPPPRITDAPHMYHCLPYHQSSSLVFHPSLSVFLGFFESFYSTKDNSTINSPCTAFPSSLGSSNGNVVSTGNTNPFNGRRTLPKG